MELYSLAPCSVVGIGLALSLKSRLLLVVPGELYVIVAKGFNLRLRFDFKPLGNQANRLSEKSFVLFNIFYPKIHQVDLWQVYQAKYCLVFHILFEMWSAVSGLKQYKTSSRRYRL